MDHDFDANLQVIYTTVRDHIALHRSATSRIVEMERAKFLQGVLSILTHFDDRLATFAFEPCMAKFLDTLDSVISLFCINEV